MSTKCDMKRGLDSISLKLKQADTNADTAGHPFTDNCHDYSITSLALLVAEYMMDEFPPLHITPSKSPAPKKMMNTQRV